MSTELHEVAQGSKRDGVSENTHDLRKQKRHLKHATAVYVILDPFQFLLIVNDPLSQ